MQRLNSNDTAARMLYYPDDAHLRGVNNAALAMATIQQKPRKWSKNMCKLYWCIAVATLNSCINGYDGSLMGSINSYKQYREYFGFDPEDGTPETGIVYAIYTIGNIVGSFFAGPFTDFKGRRVGMALGAFFIIVGTVVQATCFNLAGFMAGRFILGFGVAISATAGPAYVSEIAHPSFRGSLTGLYNVLWFAGGIPGTFIPWRTSMIEGTQSWRIPVWVQMVFAGLILLLCWTIPESPRWLISRDKHEEALRVLATYHGDGDRNAPVVQLEYREMVEDISNIGSDKRWWDYRELFNTREVRYRSMLVMLMAFFGQWSGNGPVSYYYPQMLAGAGITSNETRLLLQGLQNVVQFVGAIIGALLTDRMGRRPQLLTSTALMVVLFSIMLTLNATNVGQAADGTAVAKSAVVARAQIAMIFLFGFVYSAGWTPNQAMYPVECLRYEARAKGMGMNNFFVNIASFYNTFVTGIAFTQAGWKYYFLFIFWDMLEFAAIYFLFVETSRRTLEELTAIFQSKNPVKASLMRDELLIPEVDAGVEMKRKDCHRKYDD
ncbi:putative MFS lactose permease [Aspergillus clavatus NRRL 1]|uniref:MFS lactose permease, putative n=1 Tax=Aspergillus clavatus (strain ATCC 1007 / CBS 513.65 / DSM 816 / NCTC 3887 / NRRL 1 / QM 1276 / 107) TaxID=344612 RepID=A1CMY7_ASPCL|nr:MFS lactose permease, putative [Aspergillus clavatus NRRL 1]EAW08924.1 MFS lactose permease, putative [Aspergillus clavatus NRRL 1]